ATRQSDELAHSAVKLKCVATACLDHRTSQSFFSGSGIHQRLQSVNSKGASHLSIPLRRPLLGAPACSGIDDDKAGNPQPLDFPVDPIRCGLILGKFRSQQIHLAFIPVCTEMLPERLHCELMVLFNYVAACPGKSAA